jgi:hypothetical protein
MALGLREEAREQLEKILQLCPDPNYAPDSPSLRMRPALD